MTLYEFRQCEDRNCYFRFPSAAGDQSGDNCPICGSKTRVAADNANIREVPTEYRPQPAVIIEALLDNIRSGYNVGSIFRTADGSGIGHLYLVGITPKPTQKKVMKTALGAQEKVSWSYHPNSVELICDLKSKGYEIWAIENNSVSEHLFDIQVPVSGERPILIVIGNELAGIDPGILAQSDRILDLPMMGIKRSLNVVIAFGIVAYYLSFAGQVKSNLENEQIS